MADVMHARAAPERFPIQAAGAAHRVEPTPDHAAGEPPSGVRDQQGVVGGVRAQLVARAGVGVERCNGARVKRYLARPPVLGVTDRESPLAQLNI